MSIVERAADMLGVADKTARRQVIQVDHHVADGEYVEQASAIQTALISGDAREAPPLLQPVQRALGTSHESKPGRVSRNTLTIEVDRLRDLSMVTPDAERTPIGESFRRIKRHLLANVASPKAETGTNLVMVTSALPGEGKTFCSINLAISIAMELDRTVLLVDADVARPSVLRGLLKFA